MKQATGKGKGQGKRVRKEVDRYSPGPSDSGKRTVQNPTDSGDSDQDVDPAPPPAKKAVNTRVADLEKALSEQKDTLDQQQRSLDKVLEILQGQTNQNPQKDPPLGDTTKEKELQTIMEDTLNGKGDGENTDEKPTMSHVVAAIPAAIRKDIWSGECFDLARLMTRPAATNRRVTMDVTGNNIAVDIQHASPPKYTFKEWKDAFYRYTMCLVYQSPAEAQDLIGYTRYIEDMAARYGDTAWYSFDLEFRRLKPIRHWTWAHEADRLFMETIAGELMRDNFRPKQQRHQQPQQQRQQHQHNAHATSPNASTMPAKLQTLPEEYKTHFNEVPNGFCRRYATGICPNDADGCRFAHRCYKCFTAHPSVTCRKRAADRPHRLADSGKAK